LTYKKNKENMSDKLFSLKENFTGQKFQWVKTQDISLIGKVVKCNDVFIQNNRYIIKFDDGSTVDSTRVTSDLLMIHGDMKPLTKKEVESIYKPRQLVQPTNNENTKELSYKKTIPLSDFSSPEKKVEVIKENMFKLFNSEESQLTFKLNLKLPNKKLLKMMYNNAENKKNFLLELAEYIESELNSKIIIDSMKSILDPPKRPYTKKQSQIKISEVNE